MEKNAKETKYMYILTLLFLSVLLTALAVVYSAFLYRQNFIELKKHVDIESELLAKQGRLFLEESALSSPLIIERRAIQELGMQFPSVKTLKIISPEPVSLALEYSNSTEVIGD